MIVLNGGSSSGKTSLARALQRLLLPTPWLTLSIDDLIAALPASGGGVDIGPNGEVTVTAAFHTLERAWSVGVAAMASAGAPVIVDDVFLGGSDSQNRWRSALDGLDVLWVGVRCAPKVAVSREAARGDRVAGMAARQAELVHEGVTYDLVVDTTVGPAEECARRIVAHMG
ncbi:chloramphenicol phosphotransferase CPT family protein [Streptomyces beihaiensis]|uniref:chloramphenicol phosphotransferase CPT family protein n=1 Tax=Streptomyces beihaiensis TaxID=2984495 RepID=UPI003899E820